MRRGKDKAVTAVVAAMILMAVLITTVFADTSTTINGKTYTHPTAKQKSNITVINGVDVSYWQGTGINWAKAKQDGIDFAFLRVGYSGTSKNPISMNKDSTFETNIKNATAAGVNVGVYYWSEAKTNAEAKKEAQYVAGLIEKYRDKITMPVAMDFEFASDSRSMAEWTRIKKADGAAKARSTFTNIAKAWLSTIEAEGYTPAYYSYYAKTEPTVSGRTVNTSGLTGYKFWYAQYNTKVNYTGSMNNLEFWQHTSGGSVAGMTGRIDRNFWYYDINGNNEKTGAVNIRNAKVDLKYSQVKYTGQAVKNPVTVTHNGSTLKENTHYKLIYVKNVKNNSTARVIVKGIGKYSSSISATYKIGAENIVNEIVKPDKVTGVDIKLAEDLSKMTVSFPAAKNSVTYTVKCRDLKTNESKTYDTKGKTSFDISVSKGDTLGISVRGVNKRGDTVKNGTYSDEKPIYAANASVSASYKPADNTVKVTASAVSDEYDINMIEISETGKYTKADIKEAVANKEAIKVNKNRKYIFEIIPFKTLEDKSRIDGIPTRYGLHTYLVVFNTNVKNDGANIRVTSEDKTASGDVYYIRHYDNGVSQSSKSTTSLPYTMDTIKNHIYDISVRKNITDTNPKYTCKNMPDITFSSMKFIGAYDKTVYRLAQKTDMTSVTTTKGKITVKYSKRSCTGYEIYASLNSDFSSSKKTTVANSATVTAAISGLTSGKTYYVKMRPYKTVNGIKYTGQYCTAKTIKVK